MKGVILDKNAPKQLYQFFCSRKYRIVESCLIPQLYPAVSTHPDMQICQIDSKTFLSAPECHDYYRTALPRCRIIKGERPIGDTYPDDAAYNVAVCDKFAFHYPKCTDGVARQYFHGNNIQFVSVKQGYSKCNICFLTKNALITSDPSIHNAAAKLGFDVLKLRNTSSIQLSGFDYGFIGGACGRIGICELVICGDLRRHPEFEAINRFCTGYGISPVSAYSGPIKDIGSILEFED